MCWPGLGGSAKGLADVEAAKRPHDLASRKPVDDVGLQDGLESRCEDHLDKIEPSLVIFQSLAALPSRRALTQEHPGCRPFLALRTPGFVKSGLFRMRFASVAVVIDTSADARIRRLRLVGLAHIFLEPFGLEWRRCQGEIPGSAMLVVLLAVLQQGEDVGLHLEAKSNLKFVQVLAAKEARIYWARVPGHSGLLSATG